MNETLRKTLKQLRLSGLLESLEIRLQEAAGHALSHCEFLELILRDELAVRDNRKIERRFKAAEFRERKSLEDFDWSFNPSIPRKQIYDLASCRFLREGRDVLWLGPPGVGKSFMVQAIGYQAIKAGYAVYYRSIFDLVRDFLHDEVLGQENKILTRYLKPELLIIDDMGMKQLPWRSGECLFQVVMRRYETRSTMMTSNRPLEDWGKLLGDALAILDRFLHHAELGAKDKWRMYVRRVTLERPDYEPFFVLTNLLDGDPFSAEAVLELYGERWHIERVFQQVTEVFQLQALIGSSPRAAILQASLRLVLYNAIQVIRAYVAQANEISPNSMSPELLFRDVQKQMTCWMELGTTPLPERVCETPI